MMDIEITHTCRGSIDRTPVRKGSLRCLAWCCARSVWTDLVDVGHSLRHVVVGDAAVLAVSRLKIAKIISMRQSPQFLCLLSS